MEELMKKFGFHVQIYQDYTVSEIRDALYVGEFPLNRKKKTIYFFFVKYPK